MLDMRKALQAKPTSPLTINYKGKDYEAEYYVDGGTVFVEYYHHNGERRTPRTLVGGGAKATAEILLREALEGFDEAGKL
jgi:hypothetical protein